MHEVPGWHDKMASFHETKRYRRGRTPSRKPLYLLEKMWRHRSVLALVHFMQSVSLTFAAE
ncbi:hypothetical protein CHELA20_54527 [Hyphomicrobiales bacterium]|nr:hypothetical protein CHELA41_20399 [Hyphomicrobiales bacterium]CAH1686442.1 hypothetical protein CHELA20_54527 [Hyphomicrobiales bacterium]